MTYDPIYWEGEPVTKGRFFVWPKRTLPEVEPAEERSGTAFSVNGAPSLMTTMVVPKTYQPKKSVAPSTTTSRMEISPYKIQSMSRQKRSPSSRKLPSSLSLVKPKPKYCSYMAQQDVAKLFPITKSSLQLEFHTTRNHQATSGSTGTPVSLSWFLKNSGAASPCQHFWGSRTSILHHSKSKVDTCQCEPRISSASATSLRMSNTRMSPDRARKHTSGE